MFHATLKIVAYLFIHSPRRVGIDLPGGLRRIGLPLSFVFTTTPHSQHDVHNGLVPLYQPHMAGLASLVCRRDDCRGHRRRLVYQTEIAMPKHSANKNLRMNMKRTTFSDLN
jgi:hypothetical protein